MKAPDIPSPIGDAKDEFLAINLELLKIRAKDQLILLFNDQLKNLLGYSNSTVFLMDSDRITLFNYFPKLLTENHHDPFSRSVKTTVFNEGDEDINNPRLNQPVYIKSVKPYLLNQTDGGKLKALKLDLYNDENLMGRWIMFFGENEMPTEDTLERLPTLATLLAATLINIIDYKEVLDREMENDIIQSLNIDFAAIREKKDLLRIIHFKLKSLFDISDHFVAVINDDELTLSSFLQDTRGWAGEHPQYKRSVKAKYSLNDGIFNKVMLSKEPQIFDLRQQYARGDMPEYFQILYDASVRTVVMIGLHVRDRMIGLWCICQMENQHLTCNQLQLIKKISSQLSIAVENTKANEAISAREEEGKLLLKLSQDIANIRHKNDLFHAINRNLKKLFQFEDIVIIVLNEDQTYYSFLISLSHQSVGYTHYQKAALKKYVNEDCCLNKVMGSDGLAVLNMKQLYDNEIAPDYIKFEYENGIREKVAIKLRDDQKDIGVFFVNSAIVGSYTDHELELIEGISYQLSIAVSNILANEEIARREEEKTTLLSLSNEICALRNRCDLFNIVSTKLKQLFSINEFGITQINEDHQTYSTFILGLEGKTKNLSDFREITTDRYSVSDRVFSTVMNAEGPVLFEVNELAKEPGIPAYVGFWKRAGFQQVLCVPLRVGDTIVGSANFHIDTNPAINTKSILLKGVCAQLAVAVSNIIANEEIAKREEEITILLSLSNEIALLNTREDLFQVVNMKIKKLLSIEEFGVAQIDEGGQTYSAFVLEFTDKAKGLSDFNPITSAKYSITDPIFTRVMSSEGPVLFDVQQVAKEPGMPAYVHFWGKAGFKHYLTVPLRVGGTNIGFVNFHFEDIKGLNTKSILLKGVCAQLAVAVSNILAHEKIREREAEKTRLLEFSNEMASVRDKQVIAKILKSQLKDLFGVEDYVIYVLSKNKKTHRPFLFDPDADFARHPDFQQLIHTDTDINDGVFNEILNAEELITFNVEDWFIPAYSNAAKAIGGKTMAGISIRLGHENIAVMYFKRDGISDFAIQRPIFKSICSQIAIAIYNIIANDEIKSREEEKSMLLEFSNAIASVRDGYIFAKVLNQQLNKLFSIKDYVINILSEDEKTIIRFLYDIDNEAFKNPEFLSVLEKPINVNDGVLNKILESEAPVTFKMEEWAARKDPPVYMEAAIASEVRNLTCIRIRLGGKNIAFLSFKTDDFGVRPSSLRFLKSICSQIAIAVSNILANEKVISQLNVINGYKQQLEEEKIYLKEEIETTHNYSEIIGNGCEMQKIFRLVSKVAASDSTVLILGETGTGKELIARAIHNNSPRKNRLMVKVNCATLPVNLIESELFGHERGSFTGATERRIGKFELANNGTLFLDEIGELPLELQVKLLRALQEKEVERIGGKSTIKVDVRIIAATNRDLDKETAEGRFRSDLYYRLNIFPISLPPLRLRPEDISLLTTHFIQRFSKKMGRQIDKISNNALRELQLYNWPGNIRELEHLIERSILLTTGDTITSIPLPSPKQHETNQVSQEHFFLKTIDENERDHILNMLKYCNGRIAGESGAAQRLGVPTSTLSSKIKRLGIRREHYNRSFD
jgi:formate hydrogenlyase transcriptional activator